jgi:hypothetical protein
MNRNRLVYWCSNCNHLEIETITTKHTLKAISYVLLLGILTSLTGIGAFSVYGFVKTTDFSDLSNFRSLGNFYAGVGDIRSYFQSNDEMKQYAINVTKDCETENCKIEKLYKNVSDGWVYISDVRSNPYEIFTSGWGDCDTLSTMSKVLLKSVGVKSSFKCSSDHCFLIVFGEDKYKFDVAMAELSKI